MLSMDIWPIQPVGVGWGCCLHSANSTSGGGGGGGGGSTFGSIEKVDE